MARSIEDSHRDYCVITGEVPPEGGFSSTGNAVAMVLSPSLRRLLVVHSIEADAWGFPIGVFGGDDTPPHEVALREAASQTGLEIAALPGFAVQDTSVPLYISRR